MAKLRSQSEKFQVVPFGFAKTKAWHQSAYARPRKQTQAKAHSDKQTNIQRALGKSFQIGRVSHVQHLSNNTYESRIELTTLRYLC